MFCTLVEKNSAKLSGRSLLGISIEFSVRLRGNCVILRSFAFLTAVHKDFELPGKILLLTLLVLLFWTNRLISLLISLNFMCSLKFVADFFRFKIHFIKDFIAGEMFDPTTLSLMKGVNGTISSMIPIKQFSNKFHVCCTSSRLVTKVTSFNFLINFSLL